MRSWRWFLAALALALVTVIGCAQLKTAAPLLEPAGACIVGQLLTGNEDPLSIVADCVGITIEDVIAVVTALEAAKPTGDAGTETTAVVNVAMLERVRAKAAALRAPN